MTFLFCLSVFRLPGHLVCLRSGSWNLGLHEQRHCKNLRQTQTCCIDCSKYLCRVFVGPQMSILYLQLKPEKNERLFFQIFWLCFSD